MERAKSYYRAGLRDGIASALRGGRYAAAPPVIKRDVGSIATDGARRYRDVLAFRGDVRRSGK